MRTQVTITRRFRFEAGHRVMGHESKCAALHGHSYVARVVAVADQLDNIGRVIDFSVLKQKIGTWIDDNWDHAVILHKDDAIVRRALHDLKEAGIPSKVFLLPCNPTAENLATYLLSTVCPTVLNGTNVVVEMVMLQETENCQAEALKDDD